MNIENEKHTRCKEFLSQFKDKKAIEHWPAYQGWSAGFEVGYELGRGSCVEKHEVLAIIKEAVDRELETMMAFLAQRDSFK